MEVIIDLLSNRFIGALIFGGIGYWGGWLFRKMSPYKIAACFFVLPVPLKLLSDFDDLILTIPFAIVFLIGFLGIEHIQEQQSRVKRFLAQ